MNILWLTTIISFSNVYDDNIENITDDTRTDDTRTDDTRTDDTRTDDTRTDDTRTDDTGNIITWVMIKRLCAECEIRQTDFPLDIFNNTRTKEIQESYDRWKVDVGEGGLFNLVFGNNDMDVIIRLNDFPYTLESTIIHYVIWLRPGQNKYNFNPRMDKTLLDYIYSTLEGIHDINDDNMVYFRNASRYRTINSINHYHLMINIK